MVVRTYFLIVLLMAGTSWATEGSAWMKNPASTRVMGMAGAWGPVAEGLEAVDANPAGLPLMSGQRMSFAHFFWAQGVSVEYASFGKPLGDGIAGALSGSYSSFGIVDLYSIGAGGTPVSAGSGTPQAAEISAGCGVRIGNGFYAGASAKWAGQNLVQDWKSSIALDLGGEYRPEKRGFSAGLALDNIGTQLEGLSLPLGLEAGLAYGFDLEQDMKKPVGRKKAGGVKEAEISSIADELNLAASAKIALADTGLSTVGLGAEYWYQSKIALRAGYRFASYGDGSLRGLALGIGIRLSEIEVSYAWNALGDFGSAHQVSLSFGL